MKIIVLFLLIFTFLAIPVSAMEFTAPTAPNSAQPYMPDNQETFAQGLWYIVKTAVGRLRPELADVSKICYRLIALVILVGIINNITENAANCIRVVTAVMIGILLLEPVNSLIKLGSDTITELSDYGKLLFPVMASAMAAQGGITTSAALYTGTIIFNSVLTTIISKLIIPGVYIYLCLCVANCAVEQDMLKKTRDFVKWLISWSLKIVLYVFTGYISITGVISGTVDASSLKAAKLTISGVVPVVGKVLSDATDTILISAGVMKNAAGVYGVLVIIAVCIGPFLQIGMQYLLMKFSNSVCTMIGYKPAVSLIGDFVSGMGFVLAMTGTVCVMLLISLVCFLRGIGV